jgi:hypothetical protein
MFCKGIFLKNEDGVGEGCTLRAKLSYVGENTEQSKQLIPRYWIILAYQDINQGSLIKYKCKINSKNLE